MMSWTPEFLKNLYICSSETSRFCSTLFFFFAIFIGKFPSRYCPLVKLDFFSSLNFPIDAWMQMLFCTFNDLITAQMHSWNFVKFQSLQLHFQIDFACWYFSLFFFAVNGGENLFPNWLAWRTAKDSKSKETFFRSSIHYINQKYIQTLSQALRVPS